MSVFGGEFRCRRASHTHSYLACDVRGGTVQWNAKTVLSLFEIEDVRTYILVQIQISNFKFSCARRTIKLSIECRVYVTSEGATYANLVPLRYSYEILSEHRYPLCFLLLLQVKECRPLTLLVRKRKIPKKQL